jgi:predicted outer membrane repeat protein
MQKTISSLWYLPRLLIVLSQNGPFGKTIIINRQHSGECHISKNQCSPDKPFILEDIMLHRPALKLLGHLTFLLILCSTQVAAISSQKTHIAEQGLNNTVKLSNMNSISGRDIVLIIDTSASMAYETSGSLSASDPGDDPSVCNVNNSCQPMAAVKSSTLDFVDQLSFPSDRVSIVTMTSQTPNGSRGPVLLLPLTSNKATVEDAISSIKVFEPPVCNGTSTSTSGACRYYNSGTFVAMNCEFFQMNSLSANPDPSACPSSNVGGTLSLAGYALTGSGNEADQRLDAQWMVVALLGGPANATDTTSSYPTGFCPQSTWWQPNPSIAGKNQPWCRDMQPSVRHQATDALVSFTNPVNSSVSMISLYDADDYARDMADNLAALKDGDGVTIHTIGFGSQVLSTTTVLSGENPAGEDLLTYIATCAGEGDLGDCSEVTEEQIQHGQYFQALFQSQLDSIFTVIAGDTCSSEVVVANTLDSDIGSLRQAIADVCTGGTITFDSSLAGETIHLASTLTLSRDVTIDGSALTSKIAISGDTTNNGSADVRVFNVDGEVTANLDGLIIKKGTDGFGGGAIYNDYEAVLTVANSTFTSNSAEVDGGAIYNDYGTLTVLNSTFSGNSAIYGGGIYSGYGTMTIKNSTFSGNSAGNGGGVYTNHGTVTVTNSTFSGNSATYSGGGINNDGTVLTITNSTFSGNSAATADPEATGGGINNAGTLNYANTIIANSTSGGDCVNWASIATNMSNLVEDGSCSAALDGDPKLGALANNDGTTQTFALSVDSPAVDAGSDVICAGAAVNNLDQRGMTRPGGLHCDIGSYELPLAKINLTVGGSSQGSYALAPGGSTRKSYSGLNSGPVKLNGDPSDIVASERVIYKVNGTNTSFSEMMALPDGALDTTYWLPWYNNVDLDTQLRLGNVSGSTATVHVYIGGIEMSTSPIVLTSGQSTRVSFAGVNKGPVKIVSNVDIVAAERVIYSVNGVSTSFSEMMALPNDQLDTTYWLPWYNNVDLDTQLRIGNVSGAPASVHVYIGGTEVSGSPFALTASGPGQSTRVSFAGINNGPVKIVSNVDIVAAERVIYSVNGVGTSFSEVMALPNDQLDTTYWLPWYNNADLDTQLRFGNVSGSTANVHVYIGGVEMTGSPFSLTAGQSTRVSFAGINNGPVKIVSNVDIVAAERVIYTIGGVSTSFSEMMAFPNELLDSNYWLPWYNNVDLDTQLRFGVPQN